MDILTCASRDQDIFCLILFPHNLEEMMSLNFLTVRRGRRKLPDRRGIDILASLRRCRNRPIHPAHREINLRDLLQLLDRRLDNLI